MSVSKVEFKKTDRFDFTASEGSPPQGEGYKRDPSYIDSGPQRRNRKIRNSPPRDNVDGEGYGRGSPNYNSTGEYSGKRSPVYTSEQNE